MSHQRSSTVIKGHQGPSSVIYGHQGPSSAIKGHQSVITRAAARRHSDAPRDQRPAEPPPYRRYRLSGPGQEWRSLVTKGALKLKPGIRSSTVSLCDLAEQVVDHQLPGLSQRCHQMSSVVIKGHQWSSPARAEPMVSSSRSGVPALAPRFVYSRIRAAGSDERTRLPGCARRCENRTGRWAGDFELGDAREIRMRRRAGLRQGGRLKRARRAISEPICASKLRITGDYVVGRAKAGEGGRRREKAEEGGRRRERARAALGSPDRADGLPRRRERGGGAA